MKQTNSLVTQGFVPTPVDSIPVGMALPIPLYLPVAGKMICLRKEGDVLEAARAEQLNKKTDMLYIPEANWVGFLEELERIFEVEKGDAEKTAKNIHSVLIAYARHMERMKEVQRSNVSKLRKFAYELADLNEHHPVAVQKLLRRYSSGDVYFANHSVNVALYAIAMGKKLKMPQADLRILAFSCLVHNIGNALVPPEILYRNGSLDEKEWKLLKGHSPQGAELLEYLDAPSEAVLVARQHHERMDGKGYPYGIFGNEIHKFARICAIADVYDAITSKRPYGPKPQTSSEAIETLQGMSGKFDPDILTMMNN